jgi:sucrose-phosphate synthase
MAHIHQRPLFNRFHLVSDLDGSWFIPGRLASDVPTLVSALGCRECYLTFATGRDLASTKEVLKQCGLEPTYLITDVGTSLHRRGPYGWEEDLTYRANVASHWNEALAAKLLKRLPACVEPQPGLTPSRRLALQVCQPGTTTLDQAAEELKARMDSLGFEADVLASHGRFLEVLPKGIHKGSAVAWLRASDQIEDPLLVCGDSENDLSMLRLGAAVVVLPGHGLEPPKTPPTTKVHKASVAGPLGILEAMRAWRLAAPAPS